MGCVGTGFGAGCDAMVTRLKWLGSGPSRGWKLSWLRSWCRAAVLIVAGCLKLAGSVDADPRVVGRGEAVESLKVVLDPAPTRVAGVEADGALRPALGVGMDINQALKADDLERLQQLWYEGAKLTDWEGTGDDGLLAFCVRRRAVDVAKWLIARGADVERLGREGASPLQMAVAMNDAVMVRVLLAGGADPNTFYRFPASDGLLAITERGTMHWFLKNERRVTPLMMAANNGNVDMIRCLLDARAEVSIRSARYRLFPINFASRRSDVKAMQAMLRVDSSNEKYVLILDLSDQRLYLHDLRGEQVFTSRVSTGRAGHRTPTGEYVITNKHRRHRSNIYGVSMPYFQRLSCGAIGFHAGYVPGYPASHGCIRMPHSAARALFSMTPVGTRVTIRD